MNKNTQMLKVIDEYLVIIQERMLNQLAIYQSNA